MSKLNIAVIFGSRSCEHDVSIISALQLIEAAKTAGFTVIPVYISREGLWYTGEALTQIETFREFNPMGKGITRVNLDVSANAGDLWAWPPQRAGLFAKVPAPIAHIDVAIPVLHGLHGEDGTVQGLLEMANIPYASSGVLGSAVGMDKIAMKQMLRGAGYPVLDYVWLTRDQLKADREAIVERIEREIKYPAFVKPAALGSSIGVSKATNREELDKALDLAASYDRRILVEVGINNPVEINCAALGYGEDVRTSVCEMPVPSTGDKFLNFFEKYLRNVGTKGESSRGMKSLSRVVPAPIGEELTERIQRMTKEIFKLLDCRGTVRIDFILDENDVLYVNEPNTIPGSLAFYLWQECGVSFGKLVEIMVEDALRAHADKNTNVFAFDSTILQKVAAGAKGSKR
ncbi:MAG: D-alanine--D-alanine ligase [Clostridiales bacterium]|nr:D-alanine--D-alanine ligase [Clostridiales bacterium]MDY3762936.1 D-alanine--D-alanine ligase family protein [Candidatus Ventricola sp.]MCI6588970.1 D-alanine--D-alanine ligase [Clostridiales bacterium]MCI7705039.1 D-alanine--D-alanine ligase [Clostridiales bacterium]MDY3831887.1 D-alanine--D-alanine ligase family protein [Candidatus Ventricola sp.]